jgi:hypothetical protein
MMDSTGEFRLDDIKKDQRCCTHISTQSLRLESLLDTLEQGYVSKKHLIASTPQMSILVIGETEANFKYVFHIQLFGI